TDDGNDKWNRLKEAKDILIEWRKSTRVLFLLQDITNEEDYDDDVISFFIHCYHIRDWIIHLNTLNIRANHVDIFINEHQALKICADLANGSKHCKLTRSMRTGRQPHIAAKQKQTSTWYSGTRWW
ncbi:hypothetical protein NPI09_004770, partial [Escherichia coli]|nr:hypothetical protein [Escherichia coli]